MSDAQPPRPTYDPNELRRCIALCFSPKDLRSLAENLGVTGLGPWDRGIQDGAREVVRHFERLGTLDQLVVKLAEARPLMEWPALPPNAVSSPFAPPAPAAPAAPTDTESAPAPTPSDSPFAPQIMTAGAPVAPAPAVKPAAAPTPPAPEPVLRDPFAPNWPGTAGSSTETNPKRLDGKQLAPILGAGVVLVTLIAIGIFLAVRVGKNPESSAPEMVAGRPLRPEGPARMAADAMKRSLESLARGCDLEVSRGTDVGVWLFPAAYGQCGSRLGVAFPLPGLRVDQPRSDLDDLPPNAHGANTPRQTNPGRVAPPRPAPAPSPAKPSASDGCIDKCAATQKQCDRACGSEPSGASGFDRWQGCKTQCLSAASKCRLSCQ